MSVHVELDPICTGEETSVVVFCPVLPRAASPQEKILPSVRSPKVQPPPEEILDHVVNAPICTGAFLLVTVPSPSLPLALDPQDQSVPPVLIACPVTAPASQEAQSVSVPI